MSRRCSQLPSTILAFDRPPQFAEKAWSCVCLKEAVLCASLSPPSSPVFGCIVAWSELWHGPGRLRSSRADVVIEAGDALEALLTSSCPSCCCNVNKQGERASGVIRPKEGEDPCLRSSPSSPWVVSALLHSHRFNSCLSQFFLIVQFVHRCLVY